MDQKFTSGGTMLSGLLMLGCAFIILPLGLGCLLSYPDQIWWLGLLFLASAAGLILNGITNIKLSKRLAKDAEEDLNIISGKRQYSPTKANVSTYVNNNDQTQSIQPAIQQEVNDTIVLVKWNYTVEEWQKFLKWEMKERRLSSTIEAALIVLIGGVLGYNEGGWVMLVISIVVAIIYWLGKYYLSLASIGQPKNKQCEVVITQYALIINGKHNAFNSQMYCKGKVSIKEEPSPKILEIVYHWQTRKGISQEELRVPIPEGKLEEAKWLANTL